MWCWSYGVRIIAYVSIYVKFSDGRSKKKPWAKLRVLACLKEEKKWLFLYTSWWFRCYRSMSHCRQQIPPFSLFHVSFWGLMRNTTYSMQSRYMYIYMYTFYLTKQQNLAYTSISPCQRITPHNIANFPKSCLGISSLGRNHLTSMHHVHHPNRWHYPDTLFW